MKKQMISGMVFLTLLTGCAVNGPTAMEPASVEPSSAASIPAEESTASRTGSEENNGLYTEDTVQLEEPREIPAAQIASAAKSYSVSPQEAVKEVFDSLFRGREWYETAVLHTEETEHPYYMWEILIREDGTLITQKDSIADFRKVYPKLCEAVHEADGEEGWKERYQFGSVVSQENKYLEYSQVSANLEAYIFRLYTRRWENIYETAYEEKTVNYYAYVIESGDIVPMYLYSELGGTKFNEHYGDVTAIR